jgi:threonine/homoserine/homoserine lactone efflux protein
MFHFVIKGFIIGLMVSAPMGPINMLCIQRTLDRGHLHGFITGMGAALSDITYGLITLLGVSLISEFISKEEYTIQLVGSIVLIIFGLVVFRTNPLKEWVPEIKLEETRYVKDFVSSFLLTFSNVTIIFVFISLYARFSFNPFAHGYVSVILAIISMAVGAISWWIFLTAFVSRLRRHFNRKGLVVLNRVVGSILIIIGLVGCLLSMLQKTI